MFYTYIVNKLSVIFYYKITDRIFPNSVLFLVCENPSKHLWPTNSNFVVPIYYGTALDGRLPLLQLQKNIYAHFNGVLLKALKVITPKGVGKYTRLHVCTCLTSNAIGSLPFPFCGLP